MSTLKQIRAAYREDVRYPFYSIQAGGPKRRNHHDRHERPARLFRTDVDWYWGHFPAALRKALGLAAR